MVSGQTSMIMMVIVIIIFMGLGVFLVSTFIQSEPSDYENLYTHNLLISVLRKNTGYKTPCDTVSSVISCAHLTGRECTSQLNVRKSCREVADEIVPGLIETTIKPSYDYFMVIQPENYDVAGGTRITYGNPSVDDRVPHYTANEKVLQYDFDLRIELILARK